MLSLPESIETAINDVLSTYPQNELLKRSKSIHERYMEREKDGEHFLHDRGDIMAYLAMRVPATYAQIMGALTQIQEVMPSFQPKSLLDIGSGPGTATWAAQSIFPSLKHATLVDREKQFLYFGQEIMQKAQIPLATSWERSDIRTFSGTNYDLILVANVLNELSSHDVTELLQYLTARCTGIMVVIEPGTPNGFAIVQKATMASSLNIIAPYINSKVTKSNDYWIHFPERFTRPEFQKRIRQHMRDDSLSASDWEEAKYSYVAMSKLPIEKSFYGRCVGKVEKQKGLVKVPLLTENGIETVTVLKRNKQAYNFAKEVRWGDIMEKKNLFF